jgi:alpha-tubulin suppressor-like RCC1 family protein
MIISLTKYKGIGIFSISIFVSLFVVAQPVTKVAVGDSHTLFLKADGSLWAMGWNAYGQLGDGTTNDASFPEKILASNVVDIAAGQSHSWFLKSDGSLWGMGSVGSYQLGNPTKWTYTNRPVQLVSSGVTAISSSWYHGLFIKKDGSLWSVGSNQHGEAGIHGYDNYTLTPQKIVGGKVIAIATSYANSLYLRSDGTVWVSGENDYGQLGKGYNQGDTTNGPIQMSITNVTAIASGYGFNVFIKKDGSLWGVGGGTELSSSITNDYAVSMIAASNVTSVSSGFYHVLFTKSDGSVWGSSDNINGQLGLDDYVPDVPTNLTAITFGKIFTGGWTSFFVKNDGSLWGAGFDEYSGLGDGQSIDYNTNRFEQIIGPYDRIVPQSMTGHAMSLNFVGIGGSNYVLELATSLSPPNWAAQVTNIASAYGPLTFTNVQTTNRTGFWRIQTE